MSVDRFTKSLDEHKERNSSLLEQLISAGNAEQEWEMPKLFLYCLSWEETLVRSARQLS